VNWVTVNQSNAIERARIIIGFKENLTDKARRNIYEYFDSKKNEPGNIEIVPVNGFNFEISPEGAKQTSVQNWNINWQDENRKVLSTLTIEMPHLTYETVSYFRWGTFIENARNRLSHAVELATQTADVRRIDLEYWDRFVVNDIDNDSRSEDIIKNDVLRVLPEYNSLQHKPWHISRGWFREFEGNEYVVSQMIQPQESIGEKLAKSLSVYTRVGIDITAEMKWDNVAQNLHDLSKEIFVQTVTEEAWDLIKQKG